MELRVAAGRTAGEAVEYNDPSSVFAVETDRFVGRILVRLKGLPNEPKAFFSERKGTQISATVQGRFKEPGMLMSDCYSGFEFDKKFAYLPMKELLSAMIRATRTVLAPAVIIDPVAVCGDQPYLLNPMFSTLHTLNVAEPGSEPDLCEPLAESTTLLGGIFADGDVGAERRRIYFESVENGAQHPLSTELIYSMEFNEDKINPSTFDFSMIGMRFGLTSYVGPQPLPYPMGKFGTQPFGEDYFFNVHLWHPSAGTPPPPKARSVPPPKARSVPTAAPSPAAHEQSAGRELSAAQATSTMKDDACYIAVVDSTSNGRTASVAREKWPAFLIVPALALVALLRVTLGLGDASFASTRLVSLERDHRDDDRAGIFYGPISFDAEPGQALNKEKTVSSFAEAPKVFYRTSGGERKRYGSAQFSNASAWNGGDAKMMLGFVLADDIGVQRDVHWHTKGDEWAYVIKGTWTLTMAAPTAFSAKSRERTVPWQVTYGHSGPDSVWYFPAGWWHTIVCETPGGCAAILFFNSPPSVRVDLNSPQLAQAMHGPGEGSFGPNGMPPFVAAHVLGTSVEKAKKVQARVAGAAARDLQTEYLLGSVFDLTNACDPLTGRCPPAPAADTPPDDFPAVVQMKASEGISTRTWPFLEGGDWVGCAAADAAAAAADGSDGALDAGEAGYGGEAHAAPPLPDFAAVTAWDVTAANGFPLLSLSSQGGRGGSAGQGISGQLLEMQPGSTRPPVWTLNADAVLFVVYGSITLYLYSGDEFTGFAPSEAEGISPARQTQQITLSANQAAYVPLNNLYWFTAGCEAGGAKLTLAFNHPEWEEIGMRESLALFPTFEIEGALNEPGPTSRG